MARPPLAILPASSLSKRVAQPLLQRTAGDVAARLLAGIERSAMMVAAHALVALLGCANGGVDIVDDRWKAGRIAGVLNEQRGLGYGGRRLGKRGVRRNARPGRQPAFRRAQSRETHRAEIRRERILSPQRAIRAVGGVERQIEVAQIGVGAPDRHDGGMTGAPAVVEAAALLAALARHYALRNQATGRVVKPTN